MTTRRQLTVHGAIYDYHSLPALGEILGITLDRLPFALRILLENLMRNEDGHAVTKADIEALARWPAPAALDREVAFYPARVLMPDSSGIPLLIDLAAMRDAMVARGLDPTRVNPRIQTDLVIDHSVRADFAGSPEAFSRNLKLEMERNRERYGVVRWAMAQYDNLRVIPPSNGIVHQLNLEYLATVVATRTTGTRPEAFPDSLVGMDSHTPMINALGIFGWGVGGIEAATAMLGEPVSLLVPRIVGCRLTGRRRPGVVCTDIVLTLTERLRRHGVLAAVVEFCGPGLDTLSLPDRATIANMAAEYGATMGFFPWDAETVRYLAATARDPALLQAYATAQNLWRDGAPEPDYQEIVELDLGTVEPSLAGPSRPEDRVPLTAVPASFRNAFTNAPAPDIAATERAVQHGDIAIAAISSCTNTSNPFQIIAAGLLARNAVSRGLRAKPWVKTSISPGSRVVTAMLQKANLHAALETLGFHTVGYGCMTCGGGAGPLPATLTDQVARDKLVVLGVISTNRNFEGRLHPAIRGTYLASPPLVVAYAIAGSVLHDIANGILGHDKQGNPVRLADLWPTDEEIQSVMDETLTAALFRSTYADMADGGAEWAALAAPDSPTFAWDPSSLYLKRPPFLDTASTNATDIIGARPLLILGDNVTTDHISPGGAIPEDTPAGQYLIAHGVQPSQFSSYVARRANHEVMVRGTFANIRLRNKIAPGSEGGFTCHRPSGDLTTIFEAAERYRATDTPLIVIAGANYGCGSSRDWAAKGTQLLGIKAVIAESFERIHRSNLIGMGILPLQLPPETTASTLTEQKRSTSAASPKLPPPA
jgi:aconitate hydratase